MDTEKYQLNFVSDTPADTKAPLLNGNPTYTITDKGVLISWNDAIDDTGIAGYHLRFTNTDELLGPGITVDGTSYLIENPAAGTYTFQLNAVDAAGNISNWSTAQSFTIKADGPVKVNYTVPQAEYMYGCTATVMGMLLGYYDRHGYMGYDVSKLIKGEVELNARGLDGDKYDMDAFDTVLGNAIASQGHVERFYEINGTETTPEQEKPYTFVEGTTQLNVSVWDCIADYLGTNQFWRGVDENTGTLVYTSPIGPLTLDEILKTGETVTISNNGTNVEIPLAYSDLLGGLMLYVNNAGYALNTTKTRNEQVDCAGGTFTFEDYKKEIDAGRAVIVHITGHSMLGYGYDDATKEIIFDDTYDNNKRMRWDGSYFYSGENRTIDCVTVVEFDTKNLQLKASNAAPTVKASTTEWTNKNITLTASFAKGAKTKEYSLNGTIWMTYSKAVSVDGNMSVFFRSSDEGGVYSKVTEYKVTKIDKANPVLTAEVEDIDWGADSAAVTLSASDGESGLAQILYSLDNKKTWLEYDPKAGVVVYGNGSLFAKAVDNAGNETVEEVKIEKIDNDDPVITVRGNAAQWTNQDVLLFVSASDATSGVILFETSLNGSDWVMIEDPAKEWQQLVSQNGTFYYKATDRAGNETIREVVVDKIDKEAPVITVSSNNTDIPTGRVILTATAEDAGEITSIQYSLDNKKWKKYTGSIQITANGTIYFKAADSAGNVGTGEMTVSNIQKLTGKDTAPPAKVTGITVAEDADEKKTVISWTEPIDNVFATNYEIIIDGKKTYKSNKTEVTIKGLAAGQHTVQIIALDKAKNRSEISEPVEFSVRDITAPTKGTLVDYQLDKNRICLMMNDFTDNTKVEKYLIYKNDELVGETNSTLFIYEEPDMAGSITFKVTAVDAEGNESKAASKKLNIKDVTAPVKVSGLTVGSGASQTAVTLLWDEPYDNVGTVSYQVTLGRSGKVYTTKTNSLTIKGLAAGTESFTVVAIDKAKNKSIVSDSVSFYVGDTTKPKTGKLVLSQESTSAVLLGISKFTDNVQVAGYNIYLNGELAARTQEESYLFDFLQDDLAGKKVTFAVTAYDEEGNESKAVSKSITLKDMTAPGQVEGLTASTEGKVTTLTWDAASDNIGVTSYTVVVNGKKYTTKTNTLTLKNLKTGIYSYNVTAQDKAKNVGEVSDDFRFGVGVDLPVVPVSAETELSVSAVEESGLELQTDTFAVECAAAAVETLLETEETDPLASALAGVTL
ncbi:MAG: hypothetical protein IKC65_04720 [Lentisphaeria bacterium]|nr:hypothetical protein [Lentisphaeria bacterium]